MGINRVQVLSDPQVAYLSGGYLTLGGASTTVVLVNGVLTLIRRWLPGPIDQLSLNVTSAATAASGATLRFVVYGESSPYVPATTAAPLIDVVAAQTIDSIANPDGNKTAAVTLAGLRWVWVGCTGQGAPATQATVRSVTAFAESYIIGTVPTGNTAPSHRYTGITGAVPTPIGIAPVVESTTLPKIAMRMA